MQYSDPTELDSHTIELAETRPQMLAVPKVEVLGEIPFNVAIILGMMIAMCYVFGGIKWIIWGPFAWWAIAQVVKNNYNGINNINKYLETGMLTCVTRKRYGGVSATPFPRYAATAGRNKRYRGMA